MKKTFRGPLGWKVEADRNEVFPDDPGQGTPLLVFSPDGYSATLGAALGAGEVLDNFCRSKPIPQSVLNWLDEAEDEMSVWVYA